MPGYAVPSLNPAPVRDPLFERRAGMLVVKDNQSWTKYFELLTNAVRMLLNRPAYLQISAAQAITINDAFARLICNGTFTLTLPDPGMSSGMSVYFLNKGSGVITIAGTINGNIAGYQLVNPYQYVEISSDGSEWLVTMNN